jgi:hypothetical protein
VIPHGLRHARREPPRTQHRLHLRLVERHCLRRHKEAQPLGTWRGGEAACSVSEM